MKWRYFKCYRMSGVYIYKDDKTNNDCNDDVLNIMFKWVYIFVHC